MKKIFFVVILSFFCNFLLAHNASALLISKFDVMGGEVGTATTKTGETTQTTGDRIMNSTIVTKLGEGFAEAKAWKKNYVGKIIVFTDKVKETKKHVEGVKARVYDDNMIKIKEINSNIATVKQRKASIETELASITKEIDAEYNANKAVYEGKITTIDMNADILRKAIENDPTQKAEYEYQLTNMEDEKSSYQQQLSVLKKQADEQKKKASAKLLKDMKAVEDDLKKLYASLNNLLASSNSNPNSEQALLATRDTYFIKAGEKETPEKMEAIRVNRLLNRRRSNINAYQVSIQARDVINNKNDDAEDWGYVGATYDSTAGAVGASVEVQSRQIEALRDYSRVLVADLKMQTANDISNMTFYKLKKPEKDITQFNLDDYVYTPSKPKKKRGK